AGVYPVEAKVNSWYRSYTLKSGKLWIEDDFNLQETKGANKLHFMVAEKPVISKGKVSLANGNHVLVFDDTQFVASVEVVSQDDPRLSNVWGKELYRVTLTAKDLRLKGKYPFVIE